MRSIRACGLLVSGLFLLCSSTSTAQGPAPGSGATQMGMPAEMQQKMQKLQQIRAQLDQIRDEAMESAGMEKKRKALETQIEKAMVDRDPKAMEKKERFEHLREEFMEARKSQNQDKMQALQPELQKLGRSLQSTQSEVMKSDEISSMADRFQEAMLKQMNQVNPKTDALMAEAKSIAQELQASMGQPGPAGPRP